MTNKEILQADLLDILFEHRNKLYGAYALRKTYVHRLGLSLGVALSTVLLFILMSFIKKDDGDNKSFKNENAMILTDVNLPKEEIKQPDKPKEIQKPQKAEVKYQEFEIVEDEKADEEIPDRDAINKAEIDTENRDEEEPDGLAKPAGETVVIKGDGHEKQPEKENEPAIPNRQPSFPGGTDAWRAFLQRYLQAPEELEAGQRVEVFVRFWIDIDGSISRPEIVKSGSSAFDKEVLRVLKKMPRWEPAIQSGKFIAVPYTQPVIFIGEEQ